MAALTGSLTAEPDALVVEYRVKNDGKEPLFVAALATDAAYQTYPGSAYCALSADDLRLEVVLGASPLPTHKTVEFQAAAWAVKVRAGGDISGRLRFPMPVREWNAYALPMEPGDTPDIVRAYQVVLLVDVVRESEMTVATPTTEPQGYWSVGGRRVERLKLVITPEQTFPVVKRSDLFPRK